MDLFSYFLFLSYFILFYLVSEGEGRDMAAVVSSLVQLILDPYWRSLEGFQLLVQKEWVALGHPFCLRLSYVLGPEGEQVCKAIV